MTLEGLISTRTALANKDVEIIQETMGSLDTEVTERTARNKARSPRA